MRLFPPLEPPSRRLVFWALAGASLLVAHDAVFLVQLGPGEPLTRALRGGGHAYWEAVSTVLLALALLAAAAVVVRLATLRARARSGAGTIPTPPRGRVGLAVRLWTRLLTVVVIGFTLQENVEHLAGHDHLIGLAALHGAEYPLALPVLVLVSLVAAVLGAAVLGLERGLLAAIAALGRHGLRAPRAVPRPPARLVRSRLSPLARSGAGRAPPRLVTAPIG